MVICAILSASKSILDRSSPRGKSRDKREFAAIFCLFLGQSRKRNFGIFRIENAQNKINRDHFRISGFFSIPIKIFVCKNRTYNFLNYVLGFIIGQNSPKLKISDFQLSKIETASFIRLILLW
jgi:hypothetical protein